MTKRDNNYIGFNYIYFYNYLRLHLLCSIVFFAFSSFLIIFIRLEARL